MQNEIEKRKTLGNIIKFQTLKLEKQRQRVPATQIMQQVTKQ